MDIDPMYLAGGVAAVVILIVIVKMLGKKSNLDPGYELGKCKACGWSGKVGKYNKKCAQCGAAL